MTERHQDAVVFLLAAGYGKRLGAITETTPKPLVRVGGRALIDWNLEMIARSGFRRVFINLFHLKDQIREFVGDGSLWGLDVELVEESVLLDTGGAIKNIEPMLNAEVLLTVNSDILLGPEFSLRSVFDAHQASKALATLVLRDDKDAQSYGPIGIDAAGRVCAYLGESYFDSPVEKTLMYTGVQVLSRQVFAHMPERGSVFSVTRDTHRRLLSQGNRIDSYLYPGYWSDLGTPERLEQARHDVTAIFGIF